MARELWGRLHRYAGLAIAAFLIVAGITGSVIAFHRELDARLNPELFYVESRGTPLPPSELARRVERARPRIRVTAVPLRLAPGESALLSIAPQVNPATGRPFAVEYNQLFADPVTGRVLGAREWGACCFEREHLIPFLYTLHHRLNIPGHWGKWLMGAVALIWLFSTLVGFYLTLPRARPFLKRWTSAWKVRTRAGAYRLSFDLHRAAGLWLWSVLIVLAATSVALNLNAEVFRPLVALFSPLAVTPFDSRKARPPEVAANPAVSFEEAVGRAVEEAARRNWRLHPEEVAYRLTYGLYSVHFGSEKADFTARLGSRVLYVDDRDGRILGARVPGSGSAGDIFGQLQFPLHSGRIAGLPGRVAVCLAGIVTAMLALTGVLIWLKKRRIETAMAAKRRQTA